MTEVRASLEYLINMGDFENVKVIVDVKDTVREGENVKSAFDRVYGFVYNELAEKVRQTKRDLK